MLNKDAFEPEDAELLQASFDAIHSHDQLQIVTDNIESKEILQQTMNSMSIPANCQFSFQNLFRISKGNGSFYIAQCLIDFGFFTKRNSSLAHEYSFQLIGIARLSIDTGKTMLRPETKLDKLVGRFFDHDIDLKGADRFNDKYYLVSNKKDAVAKVFDKPFTEALARHDQVFLSTRGSWMFIHFPEDLRTGQSRIVEEIFGRCGYLSD